MIKQDMSEKQAKFVYLGIGSNLGNKFNNIEKSKFELLKFGINILSSSSYYETLSWPNPKDPKFYNIVIKISTSLTPLELLSVCKKIEKILGRKKRKKNAPRECDIDIIDYNHSVISNNPILPHKLMHQRNFVLFPLFELERNWKHPISKKSIKDLIFALSYENLRSIKKV